MTENIDYKIKTANKNEIFTHLKKCNADFFPPLDERVNINDYAEKIFEKAITFEAWQNNFLIGLIAAYWNKSDCNSNAFISNVSVIKDFMQMGIASKLLNMCITYFKQKNGSEIKLEVNKDNTNAIKFYEKFKFTHCNFKDDLIIMKLEI